MSHRPGFKHPINVRILKSRPDRLVDEEELLISGDNEREVCLRAEEAYCSLMEHHQNVAVEVRCRTLDVQNRVQEYMNFVTSAEIRERFISVHEEGR
ncbi:hypothetical protein SAMN05216548_11445 [Faunimonas pinastri]|uniref:Uncharacterized protein n=1 Tax=Faunimonas pinastri TaxID=1855383 RepID=A0A1H9MU96_9HYPH|nr:hypothetical protein [Faunimonas pinastri]SER27049.1 hypothetical protein SAMN05216548_11445 [Faunimonas pinastri]